MTRLLGRTLGETVEITLDLDPELWPVVVDPAQLDAALANLSTQCARRHAKGGSLIFVTGIASSMQIMRRQRPTSPPATMP